MEKDEETPVLLYDFLYRDHNRLNLYYSQIFEGRLQTIEELEEVKDGKDIEYKGDLKLVSARKQTAGSHTNSRKSTYGLDDLNHSNVLEFLVKHYVCEDYATAPNGTIVSVRGVLSFLDRDLLAVMVQSYQSMRLTGQLPEVGPEVDLGVDIIGKMIKDDYFEPLAFLVTEQNQSVLATV